MELTIARTLSSAAAGERPSATDALALANANDLPLLCNAAANIRDAYRPDVATYSPKVFIPLTQLCRDICSYCTFARSPEPGRSAYLSPEEVLDVARAGVRAGCREALFTLGERPELRWRSARDALAGHGFESTIHYLRHVADLVLKETGLLPHLNPGNLSAEEFAMLRPVSASMGLMLESASARLCERGGPHFGSPDKLPEARLATIRAAGNAYVPFTTGILVGIGETRRERIEALLAIRDLHDEYGHIQEVIIQNFQPKLKTRMQRYPAADAEDHLWTVAIARIVLGGGMSIQAPPNLAPTYGAALLGAGINDWGGISPVTIDYVNPEAPWPQVEKLADMTEAAGKVLAPRLAIYPEYVAQAQRWVAPQLRAAVLRLSDASGMAREADWSPGKALAPPEIRHGKPESISRAIRSILQRSADGIELDESELEQLFGARGAAFHAVCTQADELRRAVNGDIVHYVVTRNINYTNVCTYHCRFCAFSKGSAHVDLRGNAYDLNMEEFGRRVTEAWARGGTEVCLQGGIHPDYTGETYLNLLRVAKRAAAAIHVHAFSPLEVWQGAKTLGLSLIDYLRRLQAEGLASLPGTAAEILDDDIRAIICPDKIDTKTWFKVMEAAHSLGLKSTATIMFGHVERPVHWARHLVRLRSHQKRFGGFTEFVPLPFVAHEAPIYKKGLARPGPTWREAVLMHAVSRIALHPHFRHIQTSWVKMGPEGVRACLHAGADDMGGTLMNESITRAAGAVHGQEFSPGEMTALIRDTGRVPVQRTTLYGRAPQERVAAAFSAARLAEMVNTPYRSRVRKALRSQAHEIGEQ